jgi:hypothetical protein
MCIWPPLESIPNRACFGHHTLPYGGACRSFEFQHSFPKKKGFWLSHCHVGSPSTNSNYSEHRGYSRINRDKAPSVARFVSQMLSELLKYLLLTINIKDLDWLWGSHHERSSRVPSQYLGMGSASFCLNLSCNRWKLPREYMSSK